MIVVTGATGQLGKLVVEKLLETLPAAQIVAAARTPQKAQALAQKGVLVRRADYSRPESLVSAFAGAEKVLLVSVERGRPPSAAAPGGDRCRPCSGREVVGVCQHPERGHFDAHLGQGASAHRGLHPRFRHAVHITS